jgi:hypothetical protein
MTESMGPSVSQIINETYADYGLSNDGIAVAGLSPETIALEVEVSVDRDILYKVGKRIAKRYPDASLAVGFHDEVGHRSPLIKGALAPDA